MEYLNYTTESNDTNKFPSSASPRYLGDTGQESNCSAITEEEEIWLDNEPDNRWDPPPPTPYFPENIYIENTLLRSTYIFSGIREDSELGDPSQGYDPHEVYGGNSKENCSSAYAGYYERRPDVGAIVGGRCGSPYCDYCRALNLRADEHPLMRWGDEEKDIYYAEIPEDVDWERLYERLKYQARKEEKSLHYFNAVVKKDGTSVLFCNVKLKDSKAVRIPKIHRPLAFHFALLQLNAVLIECAETKETLERHPARKSRNLKRSRKVNDSNLGKFIRVVGVRGKYSFKAIEKKMEERGFELRLKKFGDNTQRISFDLKPAGVFTKEIQKLQEYYRDKDEVAWELLDYMAVWDEIKFCIETADPRDYDWGKEEMFRSV